MPEYHYSSVQWESNTFTIQQLDPGIQYQVSMQAVDANQNASGYGTDTIVTASLDTIAPSKPAAPTVAGNPLAIQVIHNLGKDSGGSFNLEYDLDHLNVYADLSPGFSPSQANFLGEIPAASSHIELGIAAIGSFQVTDALERYVVVTAVDHAGNESDPSSESTITAELIDTAYITDAAITNAKISDLAVSNAKISDLSAAKLTAGIISAGDITVSSVIKSSSWVDGVQGWRISGSGAQFNLGVEINAPLSADQITTGSLDAARIAAGTITSTHIAANTITAGDIAAATITGSRIAADTITGSNIAANTITADRIATNVITARQLMIGSSDNLVLNPSFEQEAATGGSTALDPYYVDQGGASPGWSRLTTTAARSGAWVALFDPSSVTNTAEADLIPGSRTAYRNIEEHSAVSSEDQIYFEYQVRPFSGTAWNWVRARIGFYDEDEVLLGVANGSYTEPQSGIWTRVSVTGTAPDGTAFASFFMSVRVDGETGVIMFDDLYARRKIGTSVIEDLAITSAQIEDATITGAKIGFATITDANIGSLDADKITAGIMSADRISGGTMSAVTLNAGTINSGTLVSSTVSGSLRASDGSVSAPSWSFALEPSSGMYRTSTGTVGWSALGSQKMFINSGGLTVNGYVTATTLNGFSYSRISSSGSSSSVTYQTGGTSSYGMFGGSSLAYTALSAGGATVRVSSSAFYPGTSGRNLGASGLPWGLLYAQLGSGTGTTVVWTGNQLIRSTSLRKLKTDIRPISESEINVIDRLEPSAFRWTDGDLDDIGMIKEDVGQVDTRLVMGDDWRDRPVLTLAIAAIQDLRKRINALERLF